MSTYYEETMPLDINKDEYLQFYLDESLSLSEKINSIIKKGKPFQKQALMSKLNILQTEQIFQALLKYIIDDIKTWDKESIKYFPKCLLKIMTKPSQKIVLSSINDELFNMIMKHIIISVSSTDDQIANEYISNFEQIVVFYSNKDTKFPFIINDNICDEIIALGKFGQSIFNRKLSCYLGCAVIRMIRNTENNIVKKLFNRLCYLFCDNEKEIEAQLSKELEFLIPIFKNEIFKNNDILDVINNYISCDWSHIIQTTSIISLIKNLSYIDSEVNSKLITKIFGKIKEIFEEEANYEKNFKNQIFLELILYLHDNYKSINVEIIRTIFKENIIKNFIDNNIKEEIIIENFDKIFEIFNKIANEIGIFSLSEDLDDENLCINDYNRFIDFDNLFYSIYASNFINLVNNNKNLLDKENSAKKKLYQNLTKILPLLTNFKTEKSLYEKISNMFNKEGIIHVLRCYSEKVEKNNKGKINNNNLYILISYLLKKNFDIFCQSNITPNSNKPLSPMKKDINLINNMNATENNYIKLFFIILNNILVVFNENPKLFNNNINLIICDIFQRLIPKLHKYLKPCIPNNQGRQITNVFNNYYIRIKSIDKLYEDIYKNYLIKLADNKFLGNHVRNEVICIYPYLILYSKDRTNYFKCINDKILTSEKFFNRRYSIPFIKKCFEIYSIKMFMKIGLIDIIISLINDENNNISASIINLIYRFHKKIILTQGSIFQKICKILSKMQKSDKENMTHQNFDIEKNRNIKNILNINIYKKEKNDDILLKAENKLSLRETEILSKDSNTSNKTLPKCKFPDSPEPYTFKRKNSYLNNINNINNINNNNKELFIIKNKDKFTRRGLIKDKYSSSSILINNNLNNNNNNHYNYSTKEKSNSQTILPKIKQQRNNIQSNKKITKYNIKNIINLKIKRDNTRYNELNQKNNITNNSMINIYNKLPIKQNFSVMSYNQNNNKFSTFKGNERISEPSLYPSLLPALNNNNINVEGNDDIKRKTNVGFFYK